MRGYPKFNFPAFFDAEDSLRALKWDVLNPARMDLEAHPEVDGDPEKLPIHSMWKYVERDINMLLYLARCKEELGYRVAVHFLPFWHQSVGAKAEHAVAEWLQLERIYL